jgi:hypothetical protein
LKTLIFWPHAESPLSERIKLTPMPTTGSAGESEADGDDPWHSPSDLK